MTNKNSLHTIDLLLHPVGGIVGLEENIELLKAWMFNFCICPSLKIGKKTFFAPVL